MNRKILTRLLSVLLVVVMTFGLLPVSASAAWWPWRNTAETQPAKTENQTAVAVQAATDSSEFIRIFHLDCGRKYFTVKEITDIIDQLKANNYTHMELAFGNDGLRFLLDDMSVTVGTKKYTSAEVTEAIEYGNKTEFNNESYLSTSTGTLSQAEMDDIIAYAEKQGIQIIPMMDVPGHMNAVIQAMYKLGIKTTSESTAEDAVFYKCTNKGRSFDPTNTDKVAFVKALMTKYVSYFSGKGCKFFNIAGDECGFENMYATHYKAYIALVNGLNTIIKSYGMKTMLFNDGVYSLQVKESVTDTIDTDIYICYWDASTDKYTQASELASKGYKNIINTNNKWYYVAGEEGTDWFGYNWALGFMNGTDKDCTRVDGGYNTSTGCMLAFWCDTPKATVNTDHLYNYIATLANNNPDYFKAAETPDTTELTITSSSATGALKVGESLTLTANMAANWSTEGAEVVNLSSSDDGLTATVMARSAGTAEIKAAAQSDTSKTASYIVTVTDGSEPEVTDTVPIEMTVGDTAHVETQDGVNNKGKEDTSNLNEDIAKVTVDGDNAKDDFKLATSITSGNQYYITDGNGNFLKLNGSSLTNTKDQADATLWTITKSSSNYYISSNEYYLRHASNNLGVSSTSTSNRSWSFNSTNGYFYYTSSRTTRYLRLNGSNWQVGTTNSNNGKAYTGETKPASTSITFTPVAEGTTEIIVGTIKYKITVYAKKVNVGVHLTPGDEYDLTKDIDIPANGTVTFETVSASGVDVDEDTGKLTNAVDGGEATVKATVKNKAGRTTTIYTFTITVSKEDLSGADKLPIQLWITNQTIQSDNSVQTSGTFLSGWGDEVQYIALDASTIPGVNSSNGVALSACVPELITNRYQYNTTYWKTPQDTAEENNIPYDFMLWKGKVLNSTTGLQLSGNGASKINATETGKINDFTFVRYLDGKWEVSPDQKQWREVTGSGSMGSSSTCTEQIIAYYYMQTKLTDEVTTNIVDWGNKYDKYDKSPFALLDFTVKLETGNYDPLPSAFPIAGRTYAYHCNPNLGDNTCGTDTSANVVYRRIDQIEATKADNYEIYMITLTPTSDTPSTKLNSTGASSVPEGSDIYKGTEKVIWVNTVEDLSKAGFDDESLYYAYPNGTDKFDPTDTTGKYVGGKAELSSVEIYQNQGLLVTYYVRSKAEHEIKVHYVDLVNNYEFLEIGISVGEDTYFSSNFGMNADGTLHDNTVKNVNGKPETVLSDLKLLPTVPAEYRRVTYRLVDTKRAPDTNTTDVYLYYTFDNSAVFIADFGLPMTITPAQVNGNLQGATITNAKATVSSDTPLTVNTTVSDAVVITPTKDFAAAKSGVSFTLEYTGTRAGSTESATVGYRITVVPASNVLYEENFLKTTENSGWDSSSFVQHTTTQQAQKTGETKNVFGYDDAYKTSADENGAWKASNLASDARTGALSTDFYGNAFDLIGNCGRTTGRVMLIIAKQGTKQGLKAAIVDTRYTTTIYQVPLAHLELSTEGAYTAYIYASGLDAVTASTQAAVYSAPALMSVNAADPVADVLAEYGLSVADAEYIGGDQIASSPIAVQRAPAIAAYASTIEREAGDHVEIAGFRVYRAATGTIAANYPAAEQNLTYKNILDVVDRAFVACTETESNFSATVKTYENAGGPQNEIYLAQGQSVVFGVKSTNPIQVSLRAVNGNTTWSDGTGTETAIGSITEMYYTVTPVEQDDGTTTVTIMNKGTNLLAIGNVKVPDTTTTTATSELSDDVILASVRAAYAGTPEPVEETFTPDTFKANATSLRLFRNKVVTLNISVSKDVAYVTVNGKTYTPSKFFSRWMKNAAILVTDTIGRNDSKTYTIIAYNSDGVASDPIEVKG